MTTRLIAVLIAGIFAGASASALAQSNKIWISVGDAAYAQLQKAAPQAVARESRATLAGQEKIHLVEVDERQMLALSAAVHRELHRCGGFMFHASEAAGIAALTPSKTRTTLAGLAAARPSYAIDQQSVVNPMLAQMQASNIGQTIIDMSSYANRYYTTNNGVNASNWLKQRWTTMAAGRSDIAVTQYTHSAYPQKSVILTITGTDNPNEVVVLGGHLDSINQAGTSETTKAPGADDDASGIATLTETMRVLLASDYRPERTIELMAYAAEEVGLRGSLSIARDFKKHGVRVVGALQLDMTNYQGSDKDIWLMKDFTSAPQNTFVTQLIDTYVGATWGMDACGYACSDHASWFRAGVPASMPFESRMKERNMSIHTADDTLELSRNNADHAVKFAKLGAAYAIEMAKGELGGPPIAATHADQSGGRWKLLAALAGLLVLAGALLRRR